VFLNELQLSLAKKDSCEHNKALFANRPLFLWIRQICLKDHGKPWVVRDLLWLLPLRPKSSGVTKGGKETSASKRSILGAPK